METLTSAMIEDAIEQLHRITEPLTIDDLKAIRDSTSIYLSTHIEPDIED